jgi:phosphatidylglycerophosphatase A
MANTPLRGWQDRCYFLIATAGGAGTIRFAPGTWGAVVGAGWYLAIVWCFPAEYHQPLVALAFLLACWGTVLVGPWAERYFGKKDPGAVVSDEVAGILLTLLFFQIPHSPWLTLAWAFPLTRFFDILKPPPARAIEKWPEGWGVLCDDLSSSLYAIATLWALRYCVPQWF